MSVLDPYKVLQVDPQAERDVIESAYRRLARKYHPDVSSEPDSHEKMIALNQAWEQLRDPVKRAAVDRARLRTMGNTAWVAAAAAQARTASTAQPTHGPIIAPPPGAQAGDTSWSFGSMTDPAYYSPNTTSAAGPQGWAEARVPIGGFASGVSNRPGWGATGPPPGNPSGSVLNFGRFAGWSLGEIARTEIEYLEWLDRMPIGRAYQAEIDELLRARGRRSKPDGDSPGRGGPFRRR